MELTPKRQFDSPSAAAKSIHHTPTTIDDGKPSSSLSRPNTPVSKAMRRKTPYLSPGKFTSRTLPRPPWAGSVEDGPPNDASPSITTGGLDGRPNALDRSPSASGGPLRRIAPPNTASKTTRGTKVLAPRPKTTRKRMEKDPMRIKLEAWRREREAKRSLEHQGKRAQPSLRTPSTQRIARTNAHQHSRTAVRRRGTPRRRPTILGPSGQRRYLDRRLSDAKSASSASEARAIYSNILSLGRCPDALVEADYWIQRAMFEESQGEHAAVIRIYEQAATVCTDAFTLGHALSHYMIRMGGESPISSPDGSLLSLDEESSICAADLSSLHDSLLQLTPSPSTPSPQMHEGAIGPVTPMHLEQALQSAEESLGRSSRTAAGFDEAIVRQLVLDILNTPQASPTIDGDHHGDYPLYDSSQSDEIEDGHQSDHQQCSLESEHDAMGSPILPLPSSVDSNLDEEPTSSRIPAYLRPSTPKHSSLRKGASRVYIGVDDGQEEELGLSIETRAMDETNHVDHDALDDGDHIQSIQSGAQRVWLDADQQGENTSMPSMCQTPPPRRRPPSSPLPAFMRPLTPKNSRLRSGPVRLRIPQNDKIQSTEHRSSVDGEVEQLFCTAIREVHEIQRGREDVQCVHQGDDVDEESSSLLLDENVDDTFDGDDGVDDFLHHQDDCVEQDEKDGPILSLRSLNGGMVVIDLEEEKEGQEAAFGRYDTIMPVTCTSTVAYQHKLEEAALDVEQKEEKIAPIITPVRRSRRLVHRTPKRRIRRNSLYQANLHLFEPHIAASSLPEREDES